MYEQFSDRCRKVMQLANQAAQRLYHEYVGTEHILLGFIKEGTGNGAVALKALVPDLDKVKLEVEKIVCPGPNMLTMGKLPQTPRAKKIIELAIAQAREMNHNYVGTEHLLLGMIGEGEGVAAQVLTMFGVTIQKVEVVVAKVLARQSKPVEWGIECRIPIMNLESVPTPDLEAELARRREAEELSKRTAPEERARWLRAVVSETPDRGIPNERWANDLTGDYHPSFHPTREEAERAALAFVEERNKP